MLVKKADIINPEKSDYDFRWNVRFLDRQLKFNGFDYSINSGNSPNPLLPDLIDLGECVIAGVGAGGGACLHALASLPSLKGILHLVDPDEVKPSNLNRYVYAVRVDADKKRPKVTVAKQLFRSSQVKVHKYHEAYSQFSKSLNGKSVELIVSTVDTSGTRVDIQWDLPKIILDAAVAGTQFYIKKVELGRTPCLGCTHSPQDSSGSIESKLSIVIGLPATMITELRKDNRAIEEEHIQLMKPFSKKYGFELPQPGEHFQDWYLYHCGQIPLGQGEIQIPVPFATIMPGILLAGEIIKKNHFGDHLVRDYFAYDIFGAPMDIAEIINRRQDCPICADLATIARYKKKHMLI
jgi:molybdopterin/thiamine biosynthesis adenylyltransferase